MLGEVEEVGGEGHVEDELDYVEETGDPLHCQLDVGVPAGRVHHHDEYVVAEVGQEKKHEVPRAPDKPPKLIHNLLHGHLLDLQLNVDLLHFEQSQKHEEEADLVQELLQGLDEARLRLQNSPCY